MTAYKLDTMNESTHYSRKIIDSATHVINHAIKGLNLMGQTLDHDFVKAVTLIHSPTNRVVVSGMGKSGHVGKKIAATFASTGQPSFFVHPAEACHGDLGMITPQDRLLLISTSGQNPEFTVMIDYAKRFAIPIVCITSNRNSPLAQLADVALILPPVGEACPMGLAPTTSTTLTMALGDALAVALITCNNFTSENFHGFHPGGNLGRQLSFVARYMHTTSQLPIVIHGTLMRDAIVSITSYGFGCIGVVNSKQQFLGVITDGDLRRHMADDFLDLKVEEIMTANPVTIGPKDLMFLD